MQPDNYFVNPEKIQIEHSREDDNSAFDHLYNDYIDVLLSYGTGLGFNREVLKDAIQDVFYKLYINRASIKQIKNIKYYLFRSLKNRLLDILKTNVQTSDIADHEYDFVIQMNIDEELIGKEDQVIVQNKVNALLEVLTSRQREAIFLRFIQEMEYEEIGELLDMTPQATRKLIFRAMERMRKQNLPLLILLIMMAKEPSSHIGSYFLYQETSTQIKQIAGVNK